MATAIIASVRVSEPIDLNTGHCFMEVDLARNVTCSDRVFQAGGFAVAAHDFQTERTRPPTRD